MITFSGRPTQAGQTIGKSLHSKAVNATYCAVRGSETQKGVGLRPSSYNAGHRFGRDISCLLLSQSHNLMREKKRLARS